MPILDADINLKEGATQGCSSYGTGECDNQCYDCAEEVSLRLSGEETVGNTEYKAPEKINNFDIFEDRVISLLERWRRYNDKNKDNDETGSRCITGFMMEINDSFTDALIKNKNLFD